MTNLAYRAQPRHTCDPDDDTSPLNRQCVACYEEATDDIDVPALEQAADEVLALVKSEELRQLAVRTRDEALARERKAFDLRWGRFFKCKGCGARLEARPCCSLDYYELAGYELAPRRR